MVVVHIDRQQQAAKVETAVRGEGRVAVLAINEV